MTPTFDEQKHNVISAAKDLVKILSEIHDESPSTTPEERKLLQGANLSIAKASLFVFMILDLQEQI
jgi:hypothetical protein